VSVSAPDPVLDAIVRSAVEATAATEGWILAIDHETLRVVAAAGDRSAATVGREAPGGGPEAYVVAAGQPLALSSVGRDPRLQEGLARSLGRTPASVLCVPCADGDEPLGVLELLDKQGADSFTIDDVELATLLGGLAAAALTQHVAAAPVPTPSELHPQLARLAELDPGRYATVATVVAALLARE
jgi:GAF domain-containing protein